MGIKAKIGAGVWDMAFCQDCLHHWTTQDANLEWTDEPEDGSDIECPNCQSPRVIREERG